LFTFFTTYVLLSFPFSFLSSFLHCRTIAVGHVNTGAYWVSTEISHVSQLADLIVSML